MMLTFLCLLSFSSSLDNSFDGKGHHRQVNQILGNLLRLHYSGVVMRGAGHSGPMKAGVTTHVHQMQDMEMLRES
jgi:hypothetical protein